MHGLQIMAVLIKRRNLNGSSSECLCPLNLFFWSCTTRLAQHMDLLEIWVVTQNHVGILGVQTLVKVFGSCIVAVMAVWKWPPPVWKCGSSTRVKSHHRNMCF
jgi:hypothetical protein